MKRINICDLSPKQELESVYLVKHIAVMQAKDNKKYLNIIFTDATGDLEARMWKDAQETADLISKGDFVQTSGRVNLFQGRKQFVIKSIQKINASDINKDDFISKASRSADEMYNELLSIVKGLQDVYIRDLLVLILEDEEIARRLKLWQAGKSIHHAYQSGLLEHILSCTNLSLILAPKYNVNVNYVVAGAILHDLCKIYELTDGINTEYTEEGKLVGHLVKGVELLDRFAYKVNKFPYQMKLHLKHILLSHHGEYQYGSPKIPQTSEAMLVHLIDFMDSKMHSFETVKRNDNQVGHWSGFVKHLDRIIYKDELPFYPDYIQEQSQADKKSENKQSKKNAPIKQNLGNLLKDFKVD